MGGSKEQAAVGGIPAGRRVLIVDDEPRVRDAFAEALQIAGYAVRLATNGQEGIAAGRQPETGLVVVDLFMPGVDGYQVISALRRDRPGLPIIATSGGGGFVPGPRELLDVAHFVGATRILQKPVDLRTLVDVVRALLPQAGPVPDRPHPTP
jgi:DNA-binding response OmpR family regulator